MDALLSQKQLGVACNISTNMVGKYETGKSCPSSDVLAKIASTTKVSADWLLFGRNDHDTKKLILACGFTENDIPKIICFAERGELTVAQLIRTSVRYFQNRIDGLLLGATLEDKHNA